jgi:ribonuclease HI
MHQRLPSDLHYILNLLPLSGMEGNANMVIYTDGSKTENHVGASMVAVQDSKEIHTNTNRLNMKCTVVQAELYGISMAIDWIQSQEKENLLSRD